MSTPSNINGLYHDKWFRSDYEFDQLYPLYIRQLAKKHWTPIGVARSAVEFLAADNGVKILDIGSGAGKFCLSGAYYKPQSFFYGVEQRQSLVEQAEAANFILELKNVSFINGNVTELDLKNYDHFYFYNAFYENLSGNDTIDQTVDYSGQLYNYYNRFVYRQLDKKPAGTRLATYHSMEHEVPRDFHVVGSAEGNILKFWIKV